MTKRILTITFAAAAIIGTASAEKPKNVLDVKHDITDSNIIYPESYELDTQKMLEGWYLKNYTATDDRYRRQGDTQTSDETIRQRLSQLNTIIDMPFNQIVRSYIDRYTERGRAQVSALLGLSIYYMPIFEQALEEAGLPLELKYLPVIESGLDPNAVSKHGATGLWQFMLATGKGLDLEISSLVDERRDPYRSSQKAAALLKDLYSTYGDWSLAIAAYNCGPGTVNKAIRRAGGDPKKQDYWSIYYYLPAETRGYVPMFIAANYVMNYYPYHNISPVLATKPLVTDTLMISNRVHFDQISNVLDIPVDELRVLNPQFRADIIPGRPDKMYTLVLPSQQCHAYIMSENDILAYEADRYARRIDAEPGNKPSDAVQRTIEQEADNELAQLSADDTPAVETFTQPTRDSRPVRSGASKTVSHKVEPDETLSSIAAKYGVTVADIKEWNNLTRNSVRTGQMLRITTSAEIAEASGAREVSSAKQNRQQRQETAPAQQKPTKQPTETASNGTKKNNDKGGKNSGKNNEKNSGKNNEKNSGKNGKNGGKSSANSSHKVTNGESLDKIARQHGTTVEELKKANNLKGDMIHPGDNLKIPAKGKSGSKSSGKSGKGKSGKKKKK